MDGPAAPWCVRSPRVDPDRLSLSARYIRPIGFQPYLVDSTSISTMSAPTRGRPARRPVHPPPSPHPSTVRQNPSSFRYPFASTKTSRLPASRPCRFPRRVSNAYERRTIPITTLHWTASASQKREPAAPRPLTSRRYIWDRPSSTARRCTCCSCRGGGVAGGRTLAHPHPPYSLSHSLCRSLSLSSPGRRLGCSCYRFQRVIVRALCPYL